MNIEKSTCDVRVLSGLPSLDPVTLFIQEFPDANGRIVIHCWGKAWACFFSHGCETLLHFISACGVDYLIEKLGRYHEAQCRGADGKRDRAYLERILTEVILYAREQSASKGKEAP